MQKARITRIVHGDQRIAVKVVPAADRKPLASPNLVSSRVRLLKLRYTLPDFDRTWRGKFLQMIVDRLHSHGD